MDIPQLKLLAGLVRGLLEQHEVPVGHSQALDLIAALPGLRNWPEVNAFPDRVRTCELDVGTTARLAHRLKARHALEFSAISLLELLSPPEVRQSNAYRAPKVWPSGPKAGVYVTTSQAAIDNLMRAYDEATDGELVYAEEAGSHWEGSIDLGDYGLSSKGLERVPSGTLLVVGPLKLSQQDWEASAEKLDWACIRAKYDGHRVAVLLKTPTPELLFQDCELLVKRAAPSDSNDWFALTGVVTEDGTLEELKPFVPPLPAPLEIRSQGPIDAIPASVLPGLKQALRKRPAGLLIFGSSVIEDHAGIDLVSAALTLTADRGPVARIKARWRSTPAKDMMVPEPVKALPILTSIESAYAHGYRRMVVQAGYTDLEDIIKYGKDVTFLMGAYAMDSALSTMEASRFSGFNKHHLLFDYLIAAVGVGVLQLESGTYATGDLFVPSMAPTPVVDKFGETLEFVREHRVVKWEDDLSQMIENGLVSYDAAKEALKDEQGAQKFFRSVRNRTSSTS